MSLFSKLLRINSNQLWDKWIWLIIVFASCITNEIRKKSKYGIERRVNISILLCFLLFIYWHWIYLNTSLEKFRFDTKQTWTMTNDEQVNWTTIISGCFLFNGSKSYESFSFKFVFTIHIPVKLIDTHDK